MAKANRMVNERELVVYTGANGVKINALADALKEELRGFPVVAKFATTAAADQARANRVPSIDDFSEAN